MKKAKVFEETYTHYLDELATIDLAPRAAILGGRYTDGSLTFRYYNRDFSVSAAGVTTADGPDPTFAVKVVLCRYVLMCPEDEVPVGSSLVTFREFKDAAPLTSYFANNTNKTIETHFAGKPEKLRERCVSVGGVVQSSTTHDISCTFQALPRISVIFNFNDRDEMFPAQCSLLYYASAEQFLDMECLAITGTYLTGLLIGSS